MPVMQRCLLSAGVVLGQLLVSYRGVVFVMRERTPQMQCLRIGVQAMTNEMLKPCPCCTSASIQMNCDRSIFRNQSYPGETSDEGWMARCDNCGLQTCWWHSQDQVVAAWNTRTQVAAVDRLASIWQESPGIRLNVRAEYHELARAIDMLLGNDVDE